MNTPERIIVSAKKPWESWTLWANAITIILVALAAVVQQEILSPIGLKWVIVVQAVLNAVLRIKTDRPVDFKPG